MPETLLQRIADAPRFARYGRVTRIVGLVIEAVGIEVGLGELCRVTSLTDDKSVLAETVGFHERGVLLMPLGELDGLHPGSSVKSLGRSFGVDVGPNLLGRILNGLGHPIDGQGKIEVTERVPLTAEPPNPLQREMIHEPLETGVRAIDGMLTLGRGQRIGIFAGSGVGKSTLLGMIARQASADVNVIALLGERGREVRDFIEHSLGPEGLARSVLIVATGDQAALVRARGALVATAIAEHFRDQGKQVLLMVDSVTRVAMAWREIGLAVGEPPTTKGYPPSVFAALPRLLERAGNGERGGITGIYTVLVDGDDFNEPVAECRPLDPGRPHRADSQARGRRPLPRDRRAGKQEPRPRSRHHPRPPRGRQCPCPNRGCVPRQGGPDPGGRLPEGKRSPGGSRARAQGRDSRLFTAAAGRKYPYR